MPLELSLVIPAFNEAPRLSVGYERLAPALAHFDPATIEVIVIDDGSSDDTMRRAHEVYGHLEHARFVQQPANFGKGAALRLGVGLARGTHIVTMDADVAIDPYRLDAFVAALRDHALVPGSRAINGRIEYDERLRTLAGTAFNRLVRYYTKTTWRDTQCGCKGFQLAAGRLLALVSMVDGFAYDVELFFLAEQLGLDVHPIAVTWRDVAGSSVHPVREAWRMIRDIRTLARHHYENPVVELPATISLEQVAALARDARAHGLVLARGPRESLLVLGRDGALEGVTIANALGATLRTASLAELRARRYEAV